MKKQFVLATFLVIAMAARGQSVQSFTLDQCIDFALKNAISAQNADLDERIATAKVKETIGLGLPQISGSVGVQHNQQLRRFFTQYSGQGGFIDLSSVPGIQVGDVVSAQNFFQLKSAGDAGVTISQLIFNGSYLVGLQASQAFKELSIRTTAQTHEQIVLSVTKAYYGVLINRERTKLFDANLGRLDSLLRNTKALNKNGFAEDIDVDRIQVAYNNLSAEREKFINLNQVVLALLKFQMNYPMNEPLEVAGNLGDVQVETDLSNYAQDWDYKKRPDFQVLEVNHRLQSLNVKNQSAGALPTLAGFANLGYATQSPNVRGLFQTNTNIQDEGGVGPDKWYGYSLFGVSLNWNLFTGFSRSQKIQQEKLTLLKIDNAFRQLKSAVDLEIAQASAMFQNASKTLAVQKQTLDLAAKVARVTKLKYEQGLGSNIEVIDAENSLKEAQINYYNALFDALTAKVDLDKAYGKIVIPTTTQN